MLKTITKSLILLMCLALFFLSGCGKASQKKEPKQSGSSTKEQPSELMSLMGSVDEIFENLNKIEIMQRTHKPEGGEGQQQPGGGKQSPGQGGGQGQEGGGGGQKKMGTGHQESSTKVKEIKVQGMEGGSSGGGGGGGGGGGAGGQGGQGQGGQQPAQGGQGQGQPKSKEEKLKEDVKKSWEDVDKAVKKLHQTWNDFEPKAEEENASKDALTGFEEALNKLVSSVKDQKLTDAFASVNNLQKYFSEFAGGYKKTVPPKIYDVKHYYQKAYIEGVDNKWDEAKTAAGEALKMWDEVSDDVKKEDEDLAKKMEFAIKDMEIAVKSKDMNVIEIKLNVLKDNYQAIEKLFKDKAQEEQDKKTK